MLLASDQNLQNALESSRRSYRLSLLADWAGNGAYAHTHSDLSGAVDSLSLDRDSGGELPDNVWLVEGHNVGSMSVQLSGAVAGTAVTTLLSAYATTSPLYTNARIGIRVKLTVKVDTASGVVEVPQFVGVIQSIDVDSAARAVKLEVRDLATTLKAPITLPWHGMSYYDKLAGWFDIHMNTQWVVDHVLRANGIYATPADPANTLASATGHGSLASNVGMTNTLYTVGGNSTAVFNTNGKYPGMLATPHSWGISALLLNKVGIHFIGTGRVDLSLRNVGFAVKAWHFIGGTMSAVSPAGSRVLYQLYPWENNNDDIRMIISDTGLIQAYFTYNQNGTQSTAVTRQLSGAASWRYLGLHVRRDAADQIILTLHVDGTDNSVTVAAPAFANARNLAVAFVGTHRSWSDFAMFKTPTVPAVWPGEAAHVSQADVPVGVYGMSYLPDVVAADSLDVLKSVVGAEFGKFGFDENGRFSWSAASFAPADPNSLDKVVTPENLLMSLRTDEQLDTIRNDISVTVGERYADYTDKYARVFDADNKVQLGASPGKWTVYRVPIGHNMLGGIGVRNIPRVAAVDWKDTVTEGFVAVADETYAETTSGVTVWFEQRGERQGLILINNTLGFKVWFQLPTSTGAPALRTFGVELNAEKVFTAQAVDSASISKYGRRALSLGRSEWRTRNAPYVTLASNLLKLLRHPVTTAEDVRMIGDPRVQLDDLHRIDDATGVGSNIYGLVKRISRSYDQNGLVDSATYKVVPTPPAAVDSTIWSVNGAGNSNFAASFVLGTEFYVKSTRWVKGVRWYRTSTNINASEVAVYEVASPLAGQLLPNTWFFATAPSGLGWQQTTFPGPYTRLDVGKRYRVVALFPQATSPEIPHTVNYWLNGTGAGGGDIVSGEIVAPGSLNTTLRQGPFLSTGAMAYPWDGNTGHDCYWIDVVLTDTPS